MTRKDGMSIFDLSRVFQHIEKSISKQHVDLSLERIRSKDIDW